MICRVCKIDKPANTEFFHRNKSKRCGLQSACKSCAITVSIAWRKSNLQRARDNAKKYALTHPEKIREKQRRQNERRYKSRRHPSTPEEKVLLNRDRQKRWRDRNPEKSHALASEWKKNNPEKRTAHLLVQRHPDKIHIVSECACPTENKVRHHFDYSKPFEVILLCEPCHKAEHKRLRLLAAQSANNNPEALRANILERPADMTAIAATR